MKLARPEIEPQVAEQESAPSLTTCIHLLQVHRDGHSESAYKPGDWVKIHDHDFLLRTIDGVSNTPALRVFFFGSLPNHCAEARPETLLWLQDRFDISPVFIECISNYQAKAGNAAFSRRNKQGKVVALDGFYQYSTGIGLGPAHVWFSYDLSMKSATYFISNCSEHVRHRIARCTEEPQLLCRPFAVDAFVLNDCAWTVQRKMNKPRGFLVTLESYTASGMFRKIQKDRAFFDELHKVSRTFHVISGDLVDCEERLEFILDTKKKYDAACVEFFRDRATIPITLDPPVEESLALILSRVRTWQRWSTNYVDRTTLRINIVFNFVLTQIAAETQRDGSSMFTIAALTMLFLPGTFVCAIFGMIFFQAGTDANGRATFAVSPQWWYFPLVAVPLTTLVFGAWAVWKRKRGFAGFVE